MALSPARRRQLMLVLFLFGLLTLLMYWNASPSTPEVTRQSHVDRPMVPAPTTVSAAELSSSMQIVRAENEMLHEKLSALEQRYEQLSQKNQQQMEQLELHKHQQLRHRSTATVILTYKRVDYLNRTLQNVFRYLPPSMPLFVSQDDGDQATAELIRSYSNRIVHLQNFPRWATVPPNANPSHRAYHFISKHYQFAFTQLFDRYRFDHVIVLEDDMDIAPDLFEYFEATGQLLEQDETLFCVSAWNDNGKGEFVSDPAGIRRSNFFPGLGWIMTRRLWNEIGPRWPQAYWDDWLREPAQRRSRDCIFPEISRTFTFGEHGSSGGQFYHEYLAHIRLCDAPQPWTSMDLSHLTKKNWDAQWQERLNEASRSEMTVQQLMSSQQRGKTVSVYYSSDSEFEKIANTLRIMPDFKAGVARTAYNGVVMIRYKSNDVYIRPRE